MKKFLKKLIKTIKQNRETVAIVSVSILAFIVGCFALNWWKSLLIIGVADLLLFVPVFLEKKKKKGTKGAKKGQKKDSPKKKGKFKKICKIIVIGCFVLFIIGVIAFALFFQYIAKNAPKFNPDNLYQQEASILYNTKGEIYAKLGREQREKITYDELPEVLVNAIIATEDSRFFQHNGFDLPRFLVASIKQVLTGGGGGASTLTMQLSKNFYTSTTASGFEGIKRKFTDIYMAMFQIEKKYSKEEIIEFYVNAPYLGGGAYGVEQASLNYFGKSAKDLNLAEAAMIAGLFQAPNSYDPTLHPEAAEKRRKTVLYLMERHGYITAEEKEAAEALTIDKLLNKKNDDNTPANLYRSFIDTVVAEVIENTKSATSPEGMDPYVIPMEIYTTMDPEKQEYLDNIMNGVTFSWPNEYINAGVAVVDVKTGAVSAISGGRNKTGARTLNYATSINKQIGSTSKPLYDYAPGIEYLNWSTEQLFVDEPYTYSNGTNISNWDRKYEGLLSLRDALAHSRNIPALKAFQKNKNSTIKTFVQSVGLHPDMEGGNIVHEAHAIGGYNGESPLDMAAAYATFSNGGYYIKPYSYTKIIKRETGEVIEQKIEKKRVMSEETAYMMCDLLKSARYGLYGQANVNNANYGAKTGTSNFAEATLNYWHMKDGAINDLWVTGVNPEYAISIWYGLPDLSTEVIPYVNTVYSTGHRVLFQTIAKGFFQPGIDWQKPAGVVEIEIEKETNPIKLPSEFTPDNMKTTALFKKGTEPTEISDRYSKLNNVTNVATTIKNNTLTIKWDGIATPPGISDTEINKFLDSLYSNQDYKNDARNSRIAYNNTYIGGVVYKVYSKDKDGNLKLLKTVDTTSVEIPLTSTSETTYIVKSSYSIFTANMSDGVEVKISLDNLDTVITSELKGEKTMTLTIGDKFTDPGVIVLEDSVDVSKKATIKRVIKNKAGKEVQAIDTTKAETYTITYSITYAKFTDTLTRTVTIKEREEPPVE